MPKLFVRLIPFLCFAVLIAVFAWRLSPSDGDSPAPYGDTLAGRPLPRFSLPVLVEDRPSDRLLTEKTFTGKPKILNVMASWCGPCRVEHSLLREYGESRRIPVYGIAWKDEPEALAAYLREMGNLYADIGLDPDGEAAIALGIVGVPETFLIDGDGRVAAAYRGALTADVLRAEFDPALYALRGRP